ncbi:MAG: HDOD domain-containing protein [Gammaproteobacteria bacterium]|nr:HDOD domain-containing protein [Gammaproteobacteria bacterium]MCW8986415.1 HDOD domain-containing protein [Gammaproteobacteria bacterium]MCW9030860.1 HDOD domain-containing protein [Gammaproteobacteria bacterium]
MASDLKNWVKYIGTQSIPVFNETIQSVLNLSMDEKSSSKQLADTIVQDAALTSRVIRIANSPYYNRFNTEFTNIRRIVLLIGFKKITEICLTLSILDSIVDKKTRSHVYTITIKSYHAAIQARTIAELYNFTDPDMVYISTLLFNIGEIAFWSLSGKSGRLISDLLNKSGVKHEESEKDILGITFRELSLGLVSEWKLSSLLKRALAQPSSNDINIKCISYGNLIAEQIINKDFNFDSIAEKIAKESGHSLKEVRTIILENIAVTKDTYNYYLG